VAEETPGQPSCPDCGARATARSKACAVCGYRFVEDSSRPERMRPPFTAVGTAAAAVAALAAVAVLVLDGGGDDDSRRDARSAAAGQGGPEVLSRRPLSARAAERRLEERFVAPRDDDSAAARCSALQPRPAHAIRWCHIRYPGGRERTVIVLSNPQGHELLVER
jgi:hypothetical protein